MAAHFAYLENSIDMNNRGMFSLISLLLDSVKLVPNDEHTCHIEKLENLWENEYWNGRGFEIEEDFDGLEECKFWYASFLKLADDIFERAVGDHTELSWQKTIIYYAVSISELFLLRIRSEEPKWEIKEKPIFLFPNQHK